MAAIGPVTFAGMLLSSLGADVIRIKRPSDSGGISDPDIDPLAGHGHSLRVDLRSARGKQQLLALIANADVLVEGMRPGVMERLGVGPTDCLAANDALVYARISGFGRSGPLADAPGHDINYLAIAGTLWALGPYDRPPTPPLNLLGDYGGAAMLLAVGVLSALVERSISGRGQVVDSSILQGSTLITTLFYLLRRNDDAMEDRTARGRGPFIERRLSGEAPFYRAYEAADGTFVAVGANEDGFYANLLAGLELNADDLPDRRDPANWPAITDRFAARFKTKTRSGWEAVFASANACVTPVLGLHEAPNHPHNVAAKVFTIDENGWAIPAPAPSFSRTQGSPTSDLGPIGREHLARCWKMPDSDARLALGEPDA